MHFYSSNLFLKVIEAFLLKQKTATLGSFENLSWFLMFFFHFFKKQFLCFFENVTYFINELKRVLHFSFYYTFYFTKVTRHFSSCSFTLAKYIFVASSNYCAWMVIEESAKGLNWILLTFIRHFNISINCCVWSWNLICRFQYTYYCRRWSWKKLTADAIKTICSHYTKRSLFGEERKSLCLARIVL